MDPSLFTEVGEGEYRLTGDLDFTTVPHVWEQSQAKLRADPSVTLVIDLEKVGRADSAGIALLIEWLKLVQQSNKSIRFIHVPKPTQGIIEVCELRQILPIDNA